MLHNKKGQVSETMTWVIATVVIIVVLLVSVYAASILAKAVKTVDVKESISDKGRGDFLAKQSMFSILLTKDSGNTNIYSRIDSNGNSDSFAENLFDRVSEKTFSNDSIEISLSPPGSYFGGVEEIKINKEVLLKIG